MTVRNTTRVAVGPGPVGRASLLWTSFLRTNFLRASTRGAQPHLALARLRVLLLGVVLGLVLGLAPVLPRPGLCAAPTDTMAQDLYNAVTKSPAARKNAPSSASQNGPKAPTQPKAPVVPGATAQPQDDFPAFPSPQGAQPRQTRAAPPAPARAQARQQLLTLNIDGGERQAILMAPKPGPQKRGQPAPRLPLIIFLHGAGGSAAQAMRQTGLAERAAAAGFLTVFPDGTGPEGGQTWNAWTCCGYARDQRVDDVGFLAALISRLRADFGVDPRRVYLAGFSNGAMLASRFVLERPGVAAALVAVAGYLPCDTERPTTSLPVLLIHGNRDAVARFAPTLAHPATGRSCEDYPARAQVDFWVRGLELSASAQVQDSSRSRVRVEEYFPAKKGAQGFVRFVTVKGGGHAWPGGSRERFRYCDAPTSGVDATGLVLDFFRRQPGAFAPKDAVKSAAKPGAPAKDKKSHRQ